MVVADDEVDTLLLRIGNLLDCLDTAVEDNNQFYTGLLGIIYSLDTDPIAFLLTVGDIVLNVGIELL